MTDRLRRAAEQALMELANARDHIFLSPENAQALTEEEMLVRLAAAIAVLREALTTPDSATRSAGSAESFCKRKTADRRHPPRHTED